MSQAFIAFARAHGVEIDASKLDDSGKLRRCGTTEHPRTKNGAYLFDGRSGFVFAWDGEGRAIGFNDPNARELSPQEQARRDAKRQIVRDEQAILHRKAAEWAARLLTLAKPAEHNYLHRKGFKTAQGLVLPDGELFIPMRDVRSNGLVGAQIVQWLPEEMRWEKKFLYGMRSRGACLRIGPARAREQVLVEGFATGLSVEAAIRQMKLNAAVLVCFSAHNLRAVAERTEGRRYVIADHDAAQSDPVKAVQNPGEAGQRAAIATGLGWAVPETVGADANDLHMAEGLMAVCALVMRARAAEPAAVAA
jgi:phage/plasmid primase-like uncharacterized protein